MPGHLPGAETPGFINTDLVKPGEIKQWIDLLNPKWKGRIIMTDPTIAGGGQAPMKLIAYGVPTGGDIKGWDYIKALAKQDPVFSRDSRLTVESVMRGKFPLSISGPIVDGVKFMKEGAPLALPDLGEGMYLTSGNGAVMIPKGAPHPNAAKIFLNFLLSKEGQTINDRLTEYQSSRNDVPTDHLLDIFGSFSN